MMTAELDKEVTLGVKAVTVEIGFPVFDPRNHMMCLRQGKYKLPSSKASTYYIRDWKSPAEHRYDRLKHHIEEKGFKVEPFES
jgi:hypothetical protein